MEGDIQETIDEARDLLEELEIRIESLNARGVDVRIDLLLPGTEERKHFLSFRNGEEFELDMVARIHL